jgi:prolyl 4-hydroxylase
MSSVFSPLSKAAGLATGTLLLALCVPFVAKSPTLISFVPAFPILDYQLPNPFHARREAVPKPYECHPQSYKTEIISLDPLLIYIRDFISKDDIAALLQASETRFKPSEVVRSGRGLQTSDRTSSSAGLPREDPAVVCVSKRAREFMGTMISDGWDEMGPPQLVRYTTGQRFNMHRDWFDVPQWAADGTPRKWNRMASFFAILESNCTGGETYFPNIAPVSKQQGREREDGATNAENWKWTEQDPAWRNHEDGGLAFRPITGNAVFWVNLFANGTGDYRVRHAGLPVGDGTKTAMNIWPRQYWMAE